MIMDADETKKRIIEKAIELFGKFGYSSIKTDQLAAELGISKRTLYKHFPSKKILLGTVVDTVLERIESNMSRFFERLTDPKNDFIEELLRIWDVNIKTTSVLSDHFFIDLKKNMPQTLEKFVKNREKHLRTNFDKIYEIGLKKGVFKKEVHKDILYLVHFFALKYILNPEVLSNSSFSVREAVKQIYMIIMTGVLTEKGENKFDEAFAKMEDHPINNLEMNLVT